jgi:hypothetical protein
LYLNSYGFTKQTLYNWAARLKVIFHSQSFE